MHTEIENRMVVDSEYGMSKEECIIRCGCGRELDYGETYWIVDGRVYCNDCVSEAIEDFLFEHRKVVY